NASFVIEGGNTAGSVAFFGSEATAGNGIFNINGGTNPGELPGFVQFSGGTAGNATLITHSGTNGGGGGYIRFLANDESEAQIKLFGGWRPAEIAWRQGNGARGCN